MNKTDQTRLFIFNPYLLSPQVAGLKPSLARHFFGQTGSCPGFFPLYPIYQILPFQQIARNKQERLQYNPQPRAIKKIAKFNDWQQLYFCQMFNLEMDIFATVTNKYCKLVSYLFSMVIISKCHKVHLVLSRLKYENQPLERKGYPLKWNVSFEYICIICMHTYICIYTYI